MSTIDLLIMWANLVLVIGAVLANVVGAVGDDPRQRPMWASIAALAVLYAGGYLWVMNTGDVTSWSRVYRGVSLAAWPLVWIIPPIRAVRVRRRDLGAMNARARDIERGLRR